MGHSLRPPRKLHDGHCSGIISRPPVGRRARARARGVVLGIGDLVQSRGRRIAKYDQNQSSHMRTRTHARTRTRTRARAGSDGQTTRRPARLPQGEVILNHFCFLVSHQAKPHCRNRQEMPDCQKPPGGKESSDKNAWQRKKSKRGVTRTTNHIHDDPEHGAALSLLPRSRFLRSTLCQRSLQHGPEEGSKGGVLHQASSRYASHACATLPLFPRRMRCDSPDANRPIHRSDLRRTYQ